MGTLFEMIMSEKEIKLRALFAWCMACEWSVSDLHFLFSRIYNVIHYSRLWADADTPAIADMIAWSRNDAITDLHGFMKARCFPDEIRQVVVWLFNHP